MEETQVEQWKDLENMEENWNVKWYGKYGGKLSRIVKRCWKYGRN